MKLVNEEICMTTPSKTKITQDQINRNRRDFGRLDFDGSYGHDCGSDCPKCGYPVVINNIGKNPPGQYLGLYIPSHGCDNCGYQAQEALAEYNKKFKESEERVVSDKKANKEKIDSLTKPFRKAHQ
jgi:hypothetical protein